MECTKIVEEPGEEKVKTAKTRESEKEGVKEIEDNINPYFLKSGSPEGIDYNKLI